MSPHPFDARILSISENVSKSLESLGDVVTRQMGEMAQVIERFADAPATENQRAKFDALKTQFDTDAAEIRRSLSEPNGSRTDEVDLQAAAEEALSQAYSNTVHAQQQLFSISLAAVSRAASLKLDKTE